MRSGSTWSSFADGGPRSEPVRRTADARCRLVAGQGRLGVARALAGAERLGGVEVRHGVQRPALDVDVHPEAGDRVAGRVGAGGEPAPAGPFVVVVSIRAAQPPRCLGIGTLHEPRIAVNPDVRVGRSAVIRSALRQIEPDLGHALGTEAQEGAVGGGVAQPVGADQHALLNRVTVYYDRDRIERRGLPRASG